MMRKREGWADWTAKTNLLLEMSILEGKFTNILQIRLHCYDTIVWLSIPMAHISCF